MTDFALVLSAVLFALGALGLMVRRNLLFMLISVEIMLNAAAMAFVAAGARWGQADGQVLFLLVIAVAATEATVGLAIVLQARRRLHTLDADAIGMGA